MGACIVSRSPGVAGMDDFIDRRLPSRKCGTGSIAFENDSKITGTLTRWWVCPIFQTKKTGGGDSHMVKPRGVCVCWGGGQKPDGNQETNTRKGDTRRCEQENKHTHTHTHTNTHTNTHTHNHHTQPSHKSQVRGLFQATAPSVKPVEGGVGDGGRQVQRPAPVNELGQTNVEQAQRRHLIPVTLEAAS